MIEKITNLFKTKRNSSQKFDPLTDIGDWHPQKESYDKFKRVILKHIDNRDKLTTDEYCEMHPDRDFVQMWVFRMCEELIEVMDNDEVTIDDVIKLDTYCGGHIDYLKKFALRLSDLESNEPKSQIYDL